MTGPKTSDDREKRNLAGTALFTGDLGRYSFALFSFGGNAPNAPCPMRASKEACKTQ